MRRLRQGSLPFRTGRWNDLADARGRNHPQAARFDGFCSVPVSGSKDLHGEVRQQRILGHIDGDQSATEVHAYAERNVMRQDEVAVAEQVLRGTRDHYEACRHVPVLARKAGALRNGAPSKIGFWPVT